MNRHLRVSVNLSSIRKNFKILKERLGHSSNSPLPPLTLRRGSKGGVTQGARPLIIGVVKADAYGHGAVEVSKVLVKEGIDFLAVAYLEEAIALREEGINIPIIVLFDEPDPQKYLRYDLCAVIHEERTISILEKTIKASSPPLRVHVKIDTGMGRLGFLPEEALPVLERLQNIKGIRIEGIMSHFSSAELSNKESAKEQIALFNDICIKAKKLIGDNLICHMANSAAIFSLPEACLSGVRPGLMLYGYLPGSLEEPALTPAMKVSTSLLTIRKVKKGTPISYGGTFITNRESLIGIIKTGYADGLMRSLSNRGYVLFQGKRAPVIGRICMDLTMVDLTEIMVEQQTSRAVEEQRTEEEVVILGSQGKETITARELSQWANTIPYEILTTFGGLGKRVYENEEYNKKFN